MGIGIKKDAMVNIRKNANVIFPFTFNPRRLMAN
jgi:hypothetical protein